MTGVPCSLEALWQWRSMGVKAKGEGFPQRARAKIGQRWKPIVFSWFPGGSKSPWHNIRFTNTYPGCHGALGAEGVRTDKTLLPPGAWAWQRWQDQYPQDSPWQKTTKCRPGFVRWCHAHSCIQSVPKNYLFSEWTFIQFKVLSRLPEEKICEAQSHFLPGNNSSLFQGKQQSLGRNLQMMATSGPRGELSCGVHAAQTPRPRGCSCLLTYVTSINTLGPVANASGLTGFWETQKLTPRIPTFQDRLQADPESGKTSAKSNLDTSPHAFFHMICTPHMERTWPL